MKIDGFSFAATKAGVRYQDRLDLGVIYSDKPAVTVGAFTTSVVRAAPVLVDIDRLKSGSSQAILVNSGCANACTGEQGMADCLLTGKLLADSLNIDADKVLLSSTGVIGEPLNMDAFYRGVPELAANLSADAFEDVAQAIMTTDTVQKVCYHSVEIAGKKVSFMGMAKGAGMIMPNMATMLSFIVTDAQIGFVELRDIVLPAVDKSFNRITVDGDTSTNDMVVVMANGAAENAWIESASPEAVVFAEAVQHVLKDLALQIVADGEGASKLITIRMCGARSSEDAVQLARTVANSSLVKTAFFGEDANWGRILGAMGRAGVRFDPNRVDISFGDVMLVEDGLGLGAEVEAKATELLREKEIVVTVDLKDGAACEEYYTCDFSIDYVKINADYRS